MIKINLLSEGRRPVVARRDKPKFPWGDAEPSNLLLLAGLILGVLIAGGWWWVLNSKLGDAEDKVRRAEARYAELEPIIKEVEDFKKKKEDLERKVHVIQDLKRKQQGPVHIMDMISKALPELVWLESMQVTGQTVTLRGGAMNTNAIAAFIENLDKVPEFKEPDPRSVQRRTEAAYTFELSFNFVQILPESEAEEGAGDEMDTGESAVGP